MGFNLNEEMNEESPVVSATIDLDAVLTQESELNDSLTALNESMFTLNMATDTHDQAGVISFTNEEDGKAQAMALSAIMSGSVADNVVYTQEGITETLKKVWEFIKKTFKKVIAWIKTTATKLYASFVNWNTNLKGKKEKLEKVDEFDEFKKEQHNKLVEYFIAPTLASGGNDLDKALAAIPKNTSEYNKNFKALADGMKTFSETMIKDVEETAVKVKEAGKDEAKLASAKESFTAKTNNALQADTARTSLEKSAGKLDKNTLGFKDKSEIEIGIVNFVTYNKTVSVMTSDDKAFKYKLVNAKIDNALIKDFEFKQPSVGTVTSFIDNVMEEVKNAKDNIDTRVSLVDDIESALEKAESAASKIEDEGVAKGITNYAAKMFSDSTKNAGFAATSVLMEQTRMVKAAGALADVMLSVAKAKKD